MDEQDKIEWQSYEFDYREKSADWFWAVGIIVIALAVLSIFFKNPLFALFMIIAGTAILITARRLPRVIEFIINTKGIIVDGVLYPYANLKSFWIEESPFAPPKILLKSEKFITPVIVIPIETDVADASLVRSFLLSFLHEEKLHEPITHRITNYLGF